jgi:hypothetical protein
MHIAIYLDMVALFIQLLIVNRLTRFVHTLKRILQSTLDSLLM